MVTGAMLPSTSMILYIIFVFFVFLEAHSQYSIISFGGPQSIFYYFPLEAHSQYSITFLWRPTVSILILYIIGLPCVGECCIPGHYF